MSRLKWKAEIRIALIAAFFRTHDGFFKVYESFYELDNVRETEWWKVVKGVNKTPSYFACFLVFIIGLCIILSPNIITLSLVANEPLSTAIILMVSAGMGAVLTHYIDKLLEAKHKAILHI